MAYLIAPAAQSTVQLLGVARELLGTRLPLAHPTIELERQAPDDCTDC